LRRRNRRPTTLRYLGLLFVFILTATCMIGGLYGGWTDRIVFEGSAKIACWKPKIEIKKTLDGTFTDPWTGETLSEPNRDYIAVAASFPSLFELTIYVRNSGSITLYDVVVEDTIENNVAPVELEPSKGYVEVYSYSAGHKPWDGVHFGFNEVTWFIGELEPGEMVYLRMVIATLQNPAGKYEPTSGDDGDSQWVLINRGAAVTGLCFYGMLQTQTEGISIQVEDDGVEGNGIARIVTPLPYETPWAEASIG